MKDDYYLIAKADNEENKTWLPLWMHHKDTAGVMAKLVSNWISPATFAASGLEPEAFRKAAVFLAAVHDIGKATAVFQGMISGKIEGKSEELKQRGYFLDLHTKFDEKTHHAYTGQWILQSETLSLGVTESYASIVGAHHGVPFSNFSIVENDLLRIYPSRFYGTETDETAIKKWEDTWKEIIQEACILSGIEQSTQLPKLEQPAQVLLSGLVIMADWLASNTAYFPLIPTGTEGNEEAYRDRIEEGWKRINLTEGWHPQWQYTDEQDFTDRFGFPPNAVQRMVFDALKTCKKPGIMILEAQMGIGKTEAALAATEWIAEKNGQEGLFFALPTQATSNALFSRLYDWVKKNEGDWRTSIRLAHSAAELNELYERIPMGGEAHVDDGEMTDGGMEVHPWFQGSKKALLADIVVGTVDQFLMSALARKHFMLRHIGLAGKIVVIDECHAYDAYMNQYLDRAIQWMGAYGVPVILMSATLTKQRRIKMVKSYMKSYCQFYLGEKINFREESRNIEKKMENENAYPLFTWTDGKDVYQKAVHLEGAQRKVGIEWLDNPEALANLLDDLLADGGCASIILNTVKKAQEVYGILKERLADAKFLLYHANFLMPDRLKKEQILIERMGKASMPSERYRFVLVGTQVLEQSLDYDADVMVSQPCPMDLLLQRIGRLHRHSGKDGKRPLRLQDAKCFILRDGEHNYDAGTKQIYSPYLLEKTLLKLPLTINLPYDIPALVESVYHIPNPAETAEEDKLPGMSERRNEYLDKTQRKEERGKNHLLRGPERSKNHCSLTDFLKNPENSTDEIAEASVRDSRMSLDVLALIREKSGLIRFIGEDSKEIRADMVPDLSLARKISEQRLKLPHILSRNEAVIGEIERRNAEELPLWQESPWLKGKLVLLFDEEQKTVLDNFSLSYDSEMGLRYKTFV